MYKTVNTFYLEDRVHFSSVQGLVEFYSKANIPNIEQVDGVRLKYPILKQKACFFETTHNGNGSEAVSLPLNNNNHEDNTQFTSNSLPINNASGASPKLVSREKTVSESERNGDDIKLPISPQKKKKFFFRSNSKEKLLDNVSPPLMKKVGKKEKTKSVSKEHSVASSSSSPNTSPVQTDFNAFRPPLPVPRQAELPESSKNNATGPYSVPRDTETDRTFELIDHLTVEERRKLKLCHCGLPKQESQLNAEWSVHRLKEGADKGKIFYQKGAETTWELPYDIYESLSDSQKLFIEKIKKSRFGVNHLSTSGIPSKSGSPKALIKQQVHTLPVTPPPPPPLDEPIKTNKGTRYECAESRSEGNQSETSRSALGQSEKSQPLIGQSMSQRIALINASANNMNNLNRAPVVGGIPLLPDNQSVGNTPNSTYALYSESGQTE